jgi:hypothetical protein
VADLEERVAALEAALITPLITPLRPAEAWTGEQMAEFQKAFAEAVKGGSAAYHVLPGETLVIRGRDWTPAQMREIQRTLDAAHEDGTISFRVLIVPGDELGTVQAESDDGFMKRLERVWPEFRRREMLRERASQMRLPGSAL